MHRTLGGWEVVESTLPRKSVLAIALKAYLLLSKRGEEFARREYNPELLAQQIEYI